MSCYFVLEFFSNFFFPFFIVSKNFTIFCLLLINHIIFITFNLPKKHFLFKTIAPIVSYMFWKFKHIIHRCCRLCPSVSFFFHFFFENIVFSFFSSMILLFFHIFFATQCLFSFFFLRNYTVSLYLIIV